MISVKLGVACGVLAAGALSAQIPPPPGAPPPVISTGVPPAPGEQMVIWRAGEAQCDGAAVAAVRAPNPLPAMGWTRPTNEPPAIFSFAIDATGRAMGVTRSGTGYPGDATDLMPALAAARFASGAARSGCTIRFTADRRRLDQVPVDMAMAYTVFPSSSYRPRRLWARIEPTGSTCFQPQPALLNRAYPDFTALPGEEGRPLWSMVGYDIDAGGKPVHVRTVSGSQSAPLDAASRRAVSQSRFGKGARQGCLYPYWKIANPLPAPDAPPRENFPAQPAACKTLGEWARKPQLRYPDNYRRRGIEGWAVVSYDVAPWGAIGNVRVLRAEPTSEFGQAATSMLQMAMRAPSPTGASGCIDRVQYVMGKPGAIAEEAVPAPLY